MATRLYLRADISNQAGRPVGTATTDEDWGHAGVARLICRTMSAAKGGANVAAAAVSPKGPIIPAGSNELLRLFISPALAAQTLAVGERFSHCVGFQENGIPVTWRFRGFAYLWRPGVGYIATLFGDGTSRTGVDDGWQVGEIQKTVWRASDYAALTLDIEVRLRDRIVFEAWGHSADECDILWMALQHNGLADAWSDGDIVDPPDCASFLEYSDELLFAQALSPDAANILVGARDLQVDGANVGALDGGVTVTYEPAHIEHYVDQRAGVQRVDKVAERMTITANLKEATLENLRIAWGQPTGALSAEGAKEILHVGGEDAVAEHMLVLTGKAPGVERTRTITCHRAVAVGASAHSYSKDGATVYPVTFVLVEDASKEQGHKYVTIEDDEGQFQFE